MDGLADSIVLMEERIDGSFRLDIYDMIVSFVTYLEASGHHECGISWKDGRFLLKICSIHV
jgi:hypothetical protein